MEVKTFLLVSTVALLAGPAVMLPSCLDGATGNLRHIIDLEKNINQTVFETFVEDVEVLAENGCEIDFFCKVQQILHDYRTKNKTEVEKQETSRVGIITRNLDVFITCTHENCASALKNVTNSGDARKLPALLGHLKKCIQRKNSSEGREAKDQKDP